MRLNGEQIVDSGTEEGDFLWAAFKIGFLLRCNERESINEM